MKNVFLFLAEGFEEIEAITTIDLLRRAGLAVLTVAVGDSLEVAGAHNIRIIADTHIRDTDFASADAFVLPGGLPGVTNLEASSKLLDLLRQGYAGGKLLAAICAAPSILGGLGFLEGRPAVCYPSFEEKLGGYIPSASPVVVSDNIITACSAGVTIDFALSIITALLGSEAAERVAKAIIIK